MSEEFEDIIEGEEPVEEGMVAEDAQPSGKYDRLLKDDSRKFKLSGMFKNGFWTIHLM